MITGVQNFITNSSGLMEEKILSSFTENQRIAAVVAVIFAAISAIYLLITCFRRKPDVQAAQIENPVQGKTQNNPVQDKKLENPVQEKILENPVQENILEKTEDSAPKIEKETEGISEQKSRIPPILGGDDSQVAECKELFNLLNDKQFLDPEQDKKSIKMIDDFGDDIQFGPSRDGFT